MSKVDEIIEFDKIPLGGLQDTLEKLYEAIPADKRTKEYKKAVEEFNKAAIIYNSRAGCPIYKIIK